MNESAEDGKEWVAWGMRDAAAGNVKRVLRPIEVAKPGLTVLPDKREARD